MLVCPQCQFENPNNNKFCQQCGTSLTHLSCHACGTSVSFSAETCPKCGAFTGTVWLAIIAEQGDRKPQNAGDYLDLGRRYRLMSSDRDPSILVAATKSPRQLFQTKVVDCQPLQKSVLGILLEQQADFLEHSQENPHHDREKETDPWQEIGIPNLARPYLALQDYFPSVPVIHDAWLEEKKEVILLCDRDNWQLLAQLWQQDKLSWTDTIARLKEMIALWEPLLQAGCTQSLLIESNLRVSEEQLFGLEQLYLNPPDTHPALSDLGKMWQKLWQHSERFALLTQLSEQLASGAIDSVEQLQLKLQELAQKQPMEINRPRPTIVQLPDLGVASSDPTTEGLSAVSDEDDTFDSGSMRSIGHVAETTEDMSTAVLPMELQGLTDIGYTDRGRTRHHNEDYFGMRSQVKKQQSSRGRKYHARGLYIVCDGMGGHAAGEVASAMAVETLQRYFVANWRDSLPDRETIEKGILLANQTIFNVNQKNARSGNGRMGTTLVMALVQDTKVAIAHVGDSRIYRVTRKGGIEQITVDHEVGQRAIQEGIAPEVAYARPDAYQLTQALGPHASKFIQPDVRYLDLQEDTLLLLCSDGLSDNRLIETHWQTYLTPLISSNNNLDKGLRKLIDFANQHNGHDNITAILVRMKIRPYLGSGNW